MPLPLHQTRALAAQEPPRLNIERTDASPNSQPLHFERTNALPNTPAAFGDSGTAARNLRQPNHRLGIKSTNTRPPNPRLGTAPRSVKRCANPFGCAITDTVWHNPVSGIASRNHQPPNSLSGIAVLRLFIHITTLGNALGQSPVACGAFPIALPNLPDSSRRQGIGPTANGQRQKVDCHRSALIPMAYYGLPDPLHPALSP